MDFFLCGEYFAPLPVSLLSSELRQTKNGSINRWFRPLDGKKKVEEKAWPIPKKRVQRFLCMHTCCVIVKHVFI